MVFFAEAYYAALIRETVYDAAGVRLGRIADLLLKPRERYPVLSRIVVRPAKGGEDLLIPWQLVRSASYEGFRLSISKQQLPKAEADEDEISVQNRVLDRQIVDVSGRRVVRVHDLKFGAVGPEVLLTHVDIGWRGVLRRLNLEHFTLGVCRLLHITFHERLIAWEHVQLPQEGDEIHVDESRDALEQMQPADLADIAEALSGPERAAFLGGMDDELAADALEEMEPEVAASVVGDLPDEQASDIIEEMEPDAGADLLADLPQERADALLNLMEPEEAEELRQLMRYDPESAGGLMTLDFVSIPQDLTAAAALQALREQAREIDTLYYVYAVDAEGHLQGVFSLRDLILAQSTQTIEEIMERDVVRVRVDTDQRDIAHTVAHYDLLAVPVVDEEDRLLGMVTVDDAIDAVIPTAWKKRIPRVFGR